MARSRKHWLAALTLTAGFLMPVQGNAGPILDCLHCQNRDCPRSSYSRWHICTPDLYRLHLCLHGPNDAYGVPDRYPDIPPRFKITNFPCPPVEPAAYNTHEYLAPPEADAVK